MSEATRRVRRLDVFDKDVQRWRDKVERLEEFLKIAEDILSKDPTIGKPTVTPILRGLPMGMIPGNPSIVLYYMYTMDEVIFTFLGRDGDARTGAIIL